MKQIISKTKKLTGGIWSKMIAHKIIASIVVIAIVGGGYYAYGKITSGSAGTQYVIGTARNGTLIMTVSGSGQVSASTQIDIKPQVSGNVISIPVTQGQTVKAGQLLIQLDSTDAQKTVRDAQVNLDSAQLALQKLVEPPDQLSLTQAQDAVTQAGQAQDAASSSLKQAYTSGFNSVSNAFLDLPNVITGISSILNDSNIHPSQDNAHAYYDMVKAYRPDADQFLNSALTSYQAARTAYDANLTDYTNTNRDASQATIDSLINETYQTTKTMAEAAQDANNFLQMVNDTLSTGTQVKPPAILATHQSDLQSYTATINSHLTDLLNIQNTIASDKDVVTNANLTLTEKTQALTQLQAGANPLDIQSEQLSVKQQQNALLDAENNLAYYSIRAPFAGILAKIDVNKGDPASPGTAVATVITTQKIAEISLNEVDAAKVQVGQDATLTFDALPDLTIKGQVAEVDTIGTVTQGVVNYNVQIGFDTQDSRVKPGMSVSAIITTETKDNVILVPNAAVKTQGREHYVETLNGVQTSNNQNASSSRPQTITSTETPTRIVVQVGESNDYMTEITSGLDAGSPIITRTISPSSGTTPAVTTPGAQRGGGGFGGAIRIP